jgi:hypothetical protein
MSCRRHLEHEYQRLLEQFSPMYAQTAPWYVGPRLFMDAEYAHPFQTFAARHPPILRVLVSTWTRRYIKMQHQV